LAELRKLALELDPDFLVQALGLSGIDKSAVSRITSELDEPVTALRQRR
jgi:transposase-like protein